MPALNIGTTERISTDTENTVPVVVPTQNSMAALGIHIGNIFTRNAEHRRMSGIDNKLLNSLRACKSEYSPEERAKLKAQGLSDEIFTPITDVKRRAAHSQMSEIFNAPGDRPWVINPTPLPEVPPSVAKEAFQEIIIGYIQICEQTQNIPEPEDVFRYAESRMDEVFRREVEWASVRAERMEMKVHDQLTEGGWLKAFADYTNNVCTYGTAVIKGPVPRVVLKSEIKETKLGTYKYEMVPKEILCYESVNPWDCYPSKGAKTIDDGDICIRVRFTTDELWQFANAKTKDKRVDNGDWCVDTIKAILQMNPNGGISIQGQPYDMLRQQLENDGTDMSNKCVLEGIEFYGNVRGTVLLDLGFHNTQENDPIEDDEFYEVDAISIDGYVIYCKIIDRNVGRPLSKGVFYESAESWWGDSIADKLKTIQKVMNSALRNLVMNMAMTSGPQFWVKDISRLVDKTENALKLAPWKVHRFNMGQMGQNDIPMGVMEIPSRVDEALKIFQWGKVQSDEDSGIPAYTYGTNVSGGAGRTASGLAMLTEAANRGMKAVINVTDRDVIRDIVMRTVRYNLVFDSDVSIKGDCEVNPSGVMGKILRQQEIQSLGQMANMMMQPMVFQNLGPKPLIAVLRKMFESNGMINIDDLFPSKEKIEELEMLQELQQLMAAQQGMEQQGQAEGGEQGEQQMTQGQSAEQQVRENPQEVAMRGDPAFRQESQVAERRGAA